MKLLNNAHKKVMSSCTGSVATLFLKNCVVKSMVYRGGGNVYGADISMVYRGGGNVYGADLVFPVVQLFVDCGLTKFVKNC